MTKDLYYLFAVLNWSVCIVLCNEHASQVFVHGIKNELQRKMKLNIKKGERLDLVFCFFLAVNPNLAVASLSHLLP